MYKYLLTFSAALLFIACSESFTDPRDGQKYDIVKIGNFTWMAENLNFKTSNSFCPDGDSRNCNKYGALYNFEEAKKACPEGWHLPEARDFEDLVSTAGGIDIAGKALKSTSGWFKKGDGNDTFGFNAKPAGYMYRSEKFDGIGGYAHFWSSTVDSEETAFAKFLELDFSVSKASLKTYDQGDARSVRCVK